MIGILYSFNQNRYGIFDSTIDLSKVGTDIVLTEEDVYELYYKNTDDKRPPVTPKDYREEDYTTDLGNGEEAVGKFQYPQWRIRIVYVKKLNNYRVCYIGHGEYYLVIDAITSQIYENRFVLDLLPELLDTNLKSVVM